MRRYLRLALLFARTELQYALAYRANFVFDVFRMTIVVVTSVGAALILFQYTDALNGWTLPQMLVLLGVYYVVQGLEDLMFLPSIEKLMEHVRMGTLDFTLLKPADSQFLVTTRHLQPMQLASIVIGLGIITAGASRLEPTPAVGDALLFVLMVACGGVLVYALLLGIGTLAFWFVRMENLLVIFQGFIEAGRFPVDIYPGWLRVTLSTVVPIGIAVTVPAQAIAGRLDGAGVGAMLLAAVAAGAFSRWFWRKGLRNYTGASA